MNRRRKNALLRPALRELRFKVGINLGRNAEAHGIARSFAKHLKPMHVSRFFGRSRATREKGLGHQALWHAMNFTIQRRKNEMIFLKIVVRVLRIKEILKGLIRNGVDQSFEKTDHHLAILRAVKNAAIMQIYDEK